MPVCYANPTPTFQPAMRLISAITNANPASVTTTFDHDYNTGTIVRLLVPPTYGMTQANQLQGSITVTGTDTFTIDIDTTDFDTFAYVGAGDPAYSPFDYQCPQVVPIGEDNSLLTNATQNIL